MNKPKRVNILGLAVDVITIDEAIRQITAVASQPPARYIVKPYVEFFEPEHRQLLNKAWRRLPDGVALQWAAYFQTSSGSPWQLIKTLAEILLRPRRMGRVIPEKFGGANFTWPLLEAAAQERLKVYLVGAPAGSTIEETGRFLGAAIPALNITGTCPGRDENGYFSAKLERQLLADLRVKRPDIVLIGLGFPRQEQLMQRLTQQLARGILIGEGGTFDYRQFGGRRARAPRGWQQLGLEWLWRLGLEPRRLKRQLAIPRFVWRIYKGRRKRV